MPSNVRCKSVMILANVLSDGATKFVGEVRNKTYRILSRATFDTSRSARCRADPLQ